MKEEKADEQSFEDLIEEQQEDDEQEDTLKLILDHLIEIKSDIRMLDIENQAIKRRLSKVETHAKTAVAYIKCNS